MNNPSIDEVLNKAFNLACFILDDRETAIHTVEEAMSRLDVTTAAQGKRLYYKPSASSWIGGDKPGRYRNKVLFCEMHLLQRLIYIASEVFEQSKERSFTAGEPSEREMLIHFVKHLVRITTRRNSFYVTLGINRLLYNYTTAETMETYNAVIQDPARVKDDYYYRSRKGVLMQELKRRFGSFLNVVRGPRGEERFHAAAHQSRLTDHVKECLSFFTPWDTYCLVPAGVNPIIDGIPDLSSRDKKDEDKIEVDRIHAVLHPDCYGRLVKMLGFDPPDHRLEVPHFFLTPDTNATGGGTGGSRRPSSSLSHNELNEIKTHLDDQSSRRKRVFAGMLRIVVDGKERAQLAPSRSASTRFVLEGDAELIELRSMVDGDDLLLASHLFTDRESANDSKPEITSIVLEGGQKISITVSAGEDATESVVDVAYRETGIFRAAALYLKQPVLSSSDGGQSTRLSWNTARVVPAFAMGLALLVLSVLGITQFIKQRNSGSTQPATATNDRQVNEPGKMTTPVLKENGETSSGPGESTPLASSPEDKRDGLEPSRTTKPPDTKSAKISGSDQGQPSTDVAPRRETVARNPESIESTPSPLGRNSSGLDTTRRMPGEAAAVPLSEVRKIYVEVTGPAALRESTRQQMIANLNGSGRFVSSETRDDADALLKLTVTGTNSQSTKLVVRVSLINTHGETIWRGLNSRGTYTGSHETVAADIVKGLLDDARTNRRH